MTTFRASFEAQVDATPALQTTGFPVRLLAEVTAQSRSEEALGCVWTFSGTKFWVEYRAAARCYVLRGLLLLQTLAVRSGEGFISNHKERCRKRKASLTVSAS